MTDTAHESQETPPPPERQRQQQEQQKRLCDYCNERTAVVYCRADSAKLCFSCDREVHSTNQLFSNHPRSLLCDACDASPASIFCETEHSVLCSKCDWENHSQTTLFISLVHNRRPIESYSGCPSVSDLFTIFGFDDLSNKALFLSDKYNEESNTNCFNGDELSDLFVWEPPGFVSIDDLIVTANSAHQFQAMDVPRLPKNRNAACGKHKEEIVCQLRQLAKLKPNLRDETFDIEPINGFQLLLPEQNLQPGNMYTASEHDAEPTSFPPYEDCAIQWLGEPSTLSRNHFDEIPVVPEKNSENGGCASHVNDGYEVRPQHPITKTLSVYPKVGVHELNSQERDSAISRYKEKRKTRRYDKHIRYESRKVGAESRTRIKGRFAKIEH